jgi:hypothetical protein
VSICGKSLKPKVIDWELLTPRGLVAEAEDWEWSSARWYAGLRPVPIEMDGMVPEELSREGRYGAER